MSSQRRVKKCLIGHCLSWLKHCQQITRSLNRLTNTSGTFPQLQCNLTFGHEQIYDQSKLSVFQLKSQIKSIFQNV